MVKKKRDKLTYLANIAGIGAIASVCLAIALIFSGPAVYAEDGSEEDNLLYLKCNADYGKAYEVIDKVNSERRKRGLGALTTDSTLMDAAMTRAAECVLYFEHARPNGWTWNSVSSSVNGENLGKGTSSTSKIMQLWMDSPGHRENILRSRFNSIGVACIEYGGVSYWAQLFGVGGGDSPGIPDSGAASVGIDLPGADTEGGFHLDYSITMNGLSVVNALNSSDSETEEDAEEPRPVRLSTGSTIVLGLTGDFLEFDPSKVRWEVSDPSVARIDEDGVLYVTAGGRAAITAYSGSIERAATEIDSRKSIDKVYIVDTFPKITLLDNEGRLEEGKDYTLRHKGNGKDDSAAAGASRDEEGKAASSEETDAGDSKDEKTGAEIEIRGIGEYGGILHTSL